MIANPARIKKVLFPSSTETVIDDEVLITIADGHEHLDAALDPHSFIHEGGTAIGDIDVGAGPARGFRSADVRKIAGRLALVTADDMNQALRGIPLPPQAPSIKELVADYAALREMIMTTAQAEAGLIIYLG